MQGEAWARLLRLLKEGKLTKRQIADLELGIAEWYAIHWRDDDNPKAEYRAARE